MSQLPNDLSTLNAVKAARIVALHHVHAIEHRSARLADRSDDDALHDVRVSLRRLRSVFQLYQPQLRKDVKKKLLKRLDRLARSSNPGRDSEAQIAWLGEQRGKVGEREQPGFDWLMARAEAKREASYEHIRRQFPKRYSAIVDRLCNRLKSDKIRKSDNAAFGQVASVAVRELRKTLAKRMGRLLAAPDDVRIHKTRITAKKLRYLLEPFSEQSTAAADAIHSLRTLQGLLGELHDSAILHQELSEALSEAIAHRGQAAAGPSSPSPSEDVRPGVHAIVRLLSERRDALLGRLEHEWTEPQVATFLESLDAAATALAELASGHRYLLREHPVLPSDVILIEVRDSSGALWRISDSAEPGAAARAWIAESGSHTTPPEWLARVIERQL